MLERNVEDRGPAVEVAQQAVEQMAPLLTLLLSRTVTAVFVVVTPTGKSMRAPCEPEPRTTFC